MQAANDLFLSLGVLSGLMLLGVLLRALFPPFQKWFIPSCIVGGIIGFILMNTGVINLPFSLFEQITFHLFNMSFISITLASTRKADTGTKKDKTFYGGVYISLLFALLISVQAILGGLLGFAFSGTGFNPFNGALVAHGMAQGPGQALAVGGAFEAFGIPLSKNLGLFYAAVGYLSAIFVGIPLGKLIIRKRAARKAVEDKELLTGILNRETDISVGRQTVSHANIDTLTVHIALTLFTYWLSYLFVLALGTVTSEAVAASMYSVLFVFGIAFANIVKFVLRLIKKDNLVDRKIQNSITGLFLDFLMIACFMAVSLTALDSVLIPAIVVSASSIAVSAFVCYFFMSRTGSLVVERFMAIFGIVTGTAVTGVLLLRVVDPQFETPVAGELVWFNIFNVITGLVVSFAPFAPSMGIWVWLGILFVNLVVMLFIMWPIGKKLRRGSEETIMG